MTRRADVVVIGAGVAGLSAAARLADAGLVVAVLEEAPRLGGRATAFADRETGERVDNGQHVLFGCYRETYAFLKRIGTAHLAPLEPALTLAMADRRGRTSRLRCPRWPPPWHLVAAVLTWDALPLRDRLAALRLRRILDAARRRGAAAIAAEVPPNLTVSGWLAAHGQTAALCEWLWYPLAIAALNQSPDVAAAAPFVQVLGELFGPRTEDSAIGLPSVPLDELFAHPASSFIEARGGIVRTKSPARVIVDDTLAITGVRAGHAAADVIPTDTVIVAVPWHALPRIWQADPPAALAGIVSDAARLDASPIVTVNLWFDGPVMTDRFIGLIGGRMQWAFDKSAIFGERAGHLSIVSSGADTLLRMENAEIARVAMDDLARALPEVKRARLVRSVVVREPRATFSLAPGGPSRPGTRTPLRGCYLAGDWIDTGLPATIESAVMSGHRAADAVLRDRGR